MKSRRLRYVLFGLPLGIFALLNLFTQQYYVDRSRAVPSSAAATFVEIPDASASHLLDEFATLRPLAKRPGTVFISDTFNIVYAKIENFYTKPAGMIFPSDDFLRAYFRLPTDQIRLKMLIPSLLATALDLSARRQRHFREPFFDLTAPHGRRMYDGFFADNRVPELVRHPRDTFVIADTALQSVLNRWYNSDFTKNFDVVPLGNVHNHLIFIASQYGLAYYSRSRFTSLFQLEPDLFYKGKTMAGIGRRFLLDIINPSRKIRIEMTYTETLKDDGKCILYAPWILGESMKKEQAAVIGRGSARVFFPAVRPRILVGQPYVLLDMGVNGTPFPLRRTGLMRLYGLKVPIDARELVAFGRDISAISEHDYDSLRRPSWLADPPVDLMNQNLEYSGAYEDGWISEASQYVLAHPADSTALVVRGLVPLIGDRNYHSGYRVVLNNRVIGRGEVGIGTFEGRFPIRGRISGPAKIQLFFDRFQRLPNGDGRPIAMKMYTLGFQNAKEISTRRKSDALASRQQSTWWSAMDKAGVGFGEGWYPLETYDGQTFRWANNDARIAVRARKAKSAWLVLDVEPGPGERGPGVLHFLNGAGRELGAFTITQRQIVKFPLSALDRSQSYVLHIDGGGARVPSDPRILDFRVFGFSIK